MLVSHVWKTEDGRWRQGLVGWTAALLIFAVYDFMKEGWQSPGAIQYLLILAGAIALAPVNDQSWEGRSKWSHILHSPRYTVGVVACTAAASMFVIRVGRDFKLW